MLIRRILGRALNDKKAGLFAENSGKSLENLTSLIGKKVKAIK